MFDKHLWKSDILSKDAGHWLSAADLFKYVWDTFRGQQALKG